MRCTRRQTRLEGEPVERRASPPGHVAAQELGAQRRTAQRRARRPSLHYLVPTRLEQYKKLMTYSFTIAVRHFRSRLIVGPGKYKSHQEPARALEASGADMLAVAGRR